VHDHSGGFVHHEELVVLEDDPEGYRLRRDLARCDHRGFVYYYTVTGDRAITGSLPGAIHCDMAVGDECRRLRARKRRAPGYNKIEANVAVRLDGELVPLS
jgi:hypothetical protein